METSEKLRERVRERRRLFQQSLVKEVSESNENELAIHTQGDSKSWISESKDANHIFESPKKSNWFMKEHTVKYSSASPDIKEIPASYPIIGDSLKTKLQNKILQSEQDFQVKSEVRLAMKQKLHERYQSNNNLHREKVKENIESKEEKHQKTKAKWKESLSLVLKDNEYGSAPEEAAYDFFTRIWVSEELNSVSAQLSVDAREGIHYKNPDVLEKSEKVEESDEKTTDETHLLLEDYFQTEADKYIPVQRKAVYIPNNEQIDLENKIYFYPSSKPVPENAKITEGNQPRDIETEGFYIGKFPFMTLHNIKKLENRFLKQQDKKWFGDDGKVIMQPNPCKSIPTRPLISLKQNPNLETTFSKAVIVNEETWLFDRHKNPDIWHQLDLDIFSISFTHHSLFSKEHVLVSRLKELVKSYNNSVLTDNGVYISQRLQTLRSAVTQLKEINKQDEINEISEERKERLHHYQEDIKQIRKLRDIRNAENKQLIIAIKSLWKEIKTLRETQKYTNSPIELIIHEEQTDLDDDLKIWNKEIEEELEEEKLIFSIKYKEQLEGKIFLYSMSNHTE